MLRQLLTNLLTVCVPLRQQRQGQEENRQCLTLLTSWCAFAFQPLLVLSVAALHISPHFLTGAGDRCPLYAAAMAVATTTSYAASLQDIQAAAEHIAGQAHVTPVLTCSTLDRLAGGHRLHFKCEIFQKG